MSNGEEFAKSVNESRAQVYKFVALTNLVDDLINMVDQGKIKLMPAVNLSCMNEESQAPLVEYINETGVYPSNVQSAKLKDLGNDKSLTKQQITDIMTKTIKSKDINLNKLSKYIPKEIADDKREAYIIKALKFCLENNL